VTPGRRSLDHGLDALVEILHVVGQYIMLSMVANAVEG
jgi:hypothetical protein